MRHEIYYEGIAGKIDFSTLPFIYQSESDLFDYKHQYDKGDRRDQKTSYLDSVSYAGQEKKLKIGIKHDRDYREIIGKLSEAFELDIANDYWAKLYVNGSYIPCQIMGNVKDFWDRFKRINIVELTIFTKTSLWIEEKSFSFSIHDEEERKKGFGFKGSFPTFFSRSSRSLHFNNPHSQKTRAMIMMYGPIAQPVVHIGGYPYSIDTELLDGERLVIHQINRTVTKITQTGEHVNMFNFRDKTNSVFEPISVGENTVTLNGNFSIEVILLMERMEPAWK